MNSQDIIKLYVYYVDLLFPRYNGNIYLSERERASVDSFVNRSKDPIDIDLMIGFQFFYWRNKQTRASNNRYPIQWIVGPLAYKRYKDSSEEQMHLARLFIKRYGPIKVRRKIQYNTQVGSFEDQFKRMHYNTDKGLTYCLINTTLFNHESQLCVECNFSKECKLLLKQNYRKVYMLRGYEKDPS